ncbi:MAG TPA: Type 1 glutamine amidotransferase-like domain-containing protein [Thermomicrobiales bacterium]|nr:Type 1 glutamine amidotransferase-like domain-containing protein [Thermomicrobiales bacterium]
MKLLLTSNGITNPSIEQALVEMLGKPIAESRVLLVITGIYPFPGGVNYAYQMLHGQIGGPLAALGWESVGLLELTALPSISREAWVPTLQEADALLVWGGHPHYIAYWMRESGLNDVLATLRPEMVYVGVSGGSIAAASFFGETYLGLPDTIATPLTTEEVAFTVPEGDLMLTFATANGAGLVDFAIIPHYAEADHREASVVNAPVWAAKLPGEVYALDDQSAVRVVDGVVDVVSEGRWERFTH